jgi:hypothetical protein
LKRIVKMQDGIMSKGNKSGENSNFILNSWWFVLPFIYCVHIVGNLGYDIPKGYLEKLYNTYGVN